MTTTMIIIPPCYPSSSSSSLPKKPKPKHTKPSPSITTTTRHLLLLLLLLLLTFPLTTSTPSSSSPLTQQTQTQTPLTIHEISNLRARDIKRRLTRHHGYSAVEVSKMIDKKELIETLAFEEHKEDTKRKDERRRWLAKRGILVAVACVLVVMFWPLLVQVWEVVQVNFVVYTDKKKYEISRIYTLRSLLSFALLTILLLLDALSLWLSLSILLSWILPRNSYFFPTPNIPIHPSVLLTGGKPSGSPLDRYGINMGPMMISWGLRYCYGRVERLLGKVMNEALKKKKKAEKKTKAAKTKKGREGETEEERRERKLKRRMEREERKKRMEEEEEEEERRKEMEMEKKRQREATMETSCCGGGGESRATSRINTVFEETTTCGDGDDVPQPFGNNYTFDDID